MAEQLVYADTGWVDLRPLLNTAAWSIGGGGLRVRRTLDGVTLEFWGLTSVPGSESQNLLTSPLPAWLCPSGAYYLPARRSTASNWDAGVYVTSVGALQLATGSYTSSSKQSVRWSDVPGAWPTTLAI